MPHNRTHVPQQIASLFDQCSPSCPGVSNFIQTRVGHSARSFREGAPRSAKEEYSHEGLVSHRSAVRSHNLRNDPDLATGNIAWRGVERRSSASCHVPACPCDGAPGGKTRASARAACSAAWHVATVSPATRQKLAGVTEGWPPRPLSIPEMSGLATNEIAGLLIVALLLALVLVFLLR